MGFTRATVGFMAQVEHEDAEDGFEQYPYPPRPGEEQTPREPTNAELEAFATPGLQPASPMPRKTNWAALIAVVVLYAVLIVAMFSVFPLDTWEFRFGP
ncbi:MAG: hypothetical protein KIT69_05350 [Propionibacteriaceae bacterium]|nr:hypothetical protein [Propionibacteriaceae bacterium]